MYVWFQLPVDNREEDLNVDIFDVRKQKISLEDLERCGKG